MQHYCITNVICVSLFCIQIKISQMNITKLCLSFTTILLSFSLTAQNIESLETRVDSLENDLISLDKVLKQMKAFRVAGVLQGQYQHGQPDASLGIGDSNESPDKNFSRFGLRRTRLVFGYDEGLGFASVQLDATESGVSTRNLLFGLRDPWTHRNDFTAGIFIMPFGHEVSIQNPFLESPERSTMLSYLFPGDRDLGGMFTLQAPKNHTLDFLTLNLAVIAGNGINRETDNRQNFVARLKAKKAIGTNISWIAGASYYSGVVYNPTDHFYELNGTSFNKVENSKTGTYMKREYFGFNAEFAFKSALGKTTLRGETIFGTQPGIASSSRSPNYSRRPENIDANALYKRPFIGYSFFFIQSIANSPLSVVIKYDKYDPNTKLNGNQIGTEDSRTSATDLSENVLGLGLSYDLTKQVRLLGYYDIVSNEKSSLVTRYTNDRKDNVLTLRMQYLFQTP